MKINKIIGNIFINKLLKSFLSNDLNTKYEIRKIIMKYAVKADNTDIMPISFILFIPEIRIVEETDNNMKISDFQILNPVLNRYDNFSYNK